MPKRAAQRRRTRLIVRRPLYPNLQAYVARTGDTQVRIAEAVGTSQAVISRLLRAQMIPRPDLAYRLANYARVPLESFTLDYLATHPRGVEVA